METIASILSRVRINAGTLATMSMDENSGVLPQYLLELVDCNECQNTGRIITCKEPLTVRECDCMKKRKVLFRIKKSGLSALLPLYTFDTYQTPKQWQVSAKEKAVAFSKNPKGWFFISGNSGTGKTHICTAISSELLKSGIELRYMLWRDEAPALKALVNDRAGYERTINLYKKAPALYIDDAFKGAVTDGDKNLMFEILNARYNNPALITIISSERSVEDILSIDEAIGSRIYERSKGYCVFAPAENWRLRH